jgi:hypothetical protein
MGICLQRAQRQQCAEDQIGDHGFQQGGSGQPAFNSAESAMIRKLVSALRRGADIEAEAVRRLQVGERA